MTGMMPERPRRGLTATLDDAAGCADWASRRVPDRSCLGVRPLVLSRATFNWAAIAGLAAWCMTLFIQRADRRDMLAVHTTRRRAA